MSVTGMDGNSNMASLSWASQVTGKKPVYTGGTRSGPEQTVTEKSGYYIDGVFVEEFKDTEPRIDVFLPGGFYEGNRPDYYVAPKPLSQMHQSLRKTFDTCFDTSLAKSNDYSKGENTYRNFESSVRIGISVQKGILLRLQDKMIRLENLLESDTPKVAESIEDTIMDAINYLAILKARREHEATL
jgi:hypothetical protein